MASSLFEIPTPEATELLRGRIHIMRERRVDGAIEVPPGRYGNVTAEDLAATQHRIRTGLPALPCACWRW